MFGRNLLRTIPKLFAPTPKLDIRGEDVDDDEPEGRRPQPPPRPPAPRLCPEGREIKGGVNPSNTSNWRPPLPPRPKPLDPEPETRPGFLTVGKGPGSAEVVLATDAEKPDPCASHWRGYFGSYVAWGTVQGCTSTLFARAGGRQRFSGMRVITGAAAAEWMAEHGDPLMGDGG